MTTRLVEQTRELTQDELNHVSGGVVCITAGILTLAGNGAVGAAGGSGAGKIHFSDLSSSKTIDEASVVLFQHI